MQCSSWECINSFANWVSAIGTITTAALALWLSVRDHRISIQAVLNLGIVPSNNPHVLDQNVFSLEFTNIGPRTVTITNHSWQLPFKKGWIMMFPNINTPVAHLCSMLPLELTDGKSGHIFYQINHFMELDEPERVFFPDNQVAAWFRIWFFRLYVNTSVGKSIKAKIQWDVRRELWRQYRATKMPEQHRK